MVGPGGAAARLMRAKEAEADMEGLTRRPRVRELVAWLRRRGWRPVRQHGSHETWHAGDGRVVTLVVNHPGGVVSRRVLASVRRRAGDDPGRSKQGKIGGRA